MTSSEKRTAIKHLKANGVPRIIFSAVTMEAAFNILRYYLPSVPPEQLGNYLRTEWQDGAVA